MAKSRFVTAAPTRPSQKSIIHALFSVSLGVSVDSLRAWRQQQQTQPAPGSVAPPGTPRDLERENQRLRRELAYTQRQREILKKALAICSAQPELLDDSH